MSMVAPARGFADLVLGFGFQEELSKPKAINAPALSV